MDKKYISNLRSRINRANNSFSVGGNMCLWMEFQGKSLDELQQIKAALLDSRKPLESSDLQTEIDRKIKSKADTANETYSESV